MTYSEIIPGNRLMAAFLGAMGPDLFWLPVFKTSSNSDGQYSASELQFHTDWNWLMAVVSNIDAQLPDDSFVTIEYKDCFIPVLNTPESFTITGEGETKIIAVWRACVAFIKWYNDSNGNKQQ